METVLFSDADNQVHVKEVSIKNFVKPEKGDLVKIDGISYTVDGCVHDYDKSQLIVVGLKIKEIWS